MCNLSDAIEERGIHKGKIMGLQEGQEIGLRNGKQLNMIELVCRKVKKNKSLALIAEELEEEEATILPIYEAVLKTAPDYDSSRAYNILTK